MTTSHKKSGVSGGQYYVDAMGITAEEAIQSYYASTKTGESLGTWYAASDKNGSRENSLGITHGAEFDISSERADIERFKALIDGFNPETGLPLVQNAGKKQEPNKKGRIAMHDFTCSAPKPVSVLAGLSDDKTRRKIEDIQTNAARKHMDFLSTKAYVRLGKDGVIKEPGMGLRGAFYNHCSSRLGDPQTHTHSVIFNFMEYKDKVTGQIKSAALETSDLLKWQGASASLYHAELAYGMRKLGFPIERVDKLFTVPGIDPKVIKHFSKRREQIIAAVDIRLKELGLTIGADKASRQMFSRITLETRDDKLEIARPELEKLWRDEGEKLGFTQTQINELLEHEPLVELTPEELYAEAKLAIAELMENNAVFQEPKIIVAIANRLVGKADTDAILAVAEKIKINELVESTRERKTKVFKDGEQSTAVEIETYFTTREMLAKEQSIINLSTKQDVNHVIKNAHLPEWLSDEQRVAAEHVFASKQRVAIVNGSPGAGKTALTSAVKDAFQKEGYTVVGLAAGNAQANNLGAEARLDEAKSIAKFLYRIENGLDQIDSKTLIVLDEAGMVSADDMARVLTIADRAEAKVLLLGDLEQMTGAGAGSPYRTLQQKDMGNIAAASLSEIRRQVNVDEREAAKKFLRGDSLGGLAVYVKKGDVTLESGGMEATHNAMAKRWVERSEARQIEAVAEIADYTAREQSGDLKPREKVPEEGRVLIIAQKNDEVADINRRVHDLRKEAGHLGNSYMYHTIDCTTKDERQEYSVGDHVAFRVNTIGDRVAFKGTLVGIKPAEDQPDGMVDGVMIGREKNQILIQTVSHGIVRIKEQEKVFNREVGVIADINEATGKMVIDMARGRIEVDPRDENWQTKEGKLGVQLGYAVNTYGSQGQTVREAIVKLDSHRAATGVQMSRHTHQAHVYLDREHFYQQKMARSRADDWKPYQEYKVDELMADVHATLSKENVKISTLDFKQWKDATGAVVNAKAEMKLAEEPRITAAAKIVAEREIDRIKTASRFGSRFASVATTATESDHEHLDIDENDDVVVRVKSESRFGSKFDNIKKTNSDQNDHESLDHDEDHTEIEAPRANAPTRFSEISYTKSAPPPGVTSSIKTNKAFPVQLTDKYRQAKPKSSFEEAAKEIHRLRDDGISLSTMNAAVKDGFVTFDKDKAVFLGRRPEDDEVVNVQHDEKRSGALRDRFPPILNGSDEVHIVSTGRDALHVWAYCDDQGKKRPTVIVAHTKDSLSLPHVHNIIEKAKKQVIDHTQERNQVEARKEVVKADVKREEIKPAVKEPVQQVKEVRRDEVKKEETKREPSIEDMRSANQAAQAAERAAAEAAARQAAEEAARQAAEAEAAQHRTL